jgi:hypothetical protein
VAHNDGDCKCFHKRARVTESAQITGKFVATGDEAWTGEIPFIAVFRAKSQLVPEV